MTRKTKKRLIAYLGALCMATSVLAVSCKNDTPTAKEEPTVYELTLNVESVAVYVGESYTLEIAQYNGQRDVEWKSSDESVATVENGMVTGVSAGSVTITATAGSAESSCIVFVKERAQENNEASLKVTLGKQALYTEETTAISAKFYKGNKEASGAAFTYASSDENIVSVDASGTVTAKAEGQASITVCADLDGTTVAKAVNITVKPDYELSLDKNSLTLSAIASWGNKTFTNTATAKAELCFRGNPQSGVSVAWSSADESVATVNGGAVTAVKCGETQITATYQKDGRAYEASLTAIVERAELGMLSQTAYETPVATAYALSGVAGYTELPGEVELLSMWRNGASTQLASGSVETLTIPQKYSGRDIQITVSTDRATASFLVSAFIPVSDYQSLTALQTANGGYYKLTEDIDMHGLDWLYAEETYFNGVFNGDGHTISGLTLTGAHGLFYGAEGEATVENLVLSEVNIQSTEQSVGALFAKDMSGTVFTIKNVTIEASLPATGINGGLLGVIKGNVNLENVSVFAYQPTHDTSCGGALFASLSGQLTAKSVKMNIRSVPKVCALLPKVPPLILPFRTAGTALGMKKTFTLPSKLREENF